MCIFDLSQGVFVFAFPFSQCKIDTCLFLKSPERVPQWQVGSCTSIFRTPNSELLDTKSFSFFSLRKILGGKNVPVHLLLGPIEVGCSGILPLGPDILATLVVNYASQLNHSRAHPFQPPHQGFYMVGVDVGLVAL